MQLALLRCAPFVPQTITGHCPKDFGDVQTWACNMQQKQKQSPNAKQNKERARQGAGAT